jgi:hypothetical protein
VSSNFSDPSDYHSAALLGQRFKLPVITNVTQLQSFKFLLKYSFAQTFRILELHQVSLQSSDKASGGRTQPPLSMYINLAKICGDRGQGGELVVKACRGKRTGLGLVWDVTAGLGRDATILSAQGGPGARVVLFERCAVIGALLDDGLQRLATCPKHGWVADRMELVIADALDVLEAPLPQPFSCVAETATTLPPHSVSPPVPPPSNPHFLPPQAQWPLQRSPRWTPSVRPEVVYVDPMFPPRTKTALVKKEMQLLHQLLGSNGHQATGAESDVPDDSISMTPAAAIPTAAVSSAASVPDTCPDLACAQVIMAPVTPGASAMLHEERRMLEGALKWALRRTVVKRPLHAGPLAGVAPSQAILGSTNRFDIYLAAHPLALAVALADEQASRKQQPL